ncbi:MAG: hypothetical protein KDB32_02245 [Planctomycetes bacterium]|nr:hypothetical protein [Planctomycetota bacterium]
MVWFRTAKLCMVVIMSGLALAACGTGNTPAAENATGNESPSNVENGNDSASEEQPELPKEAAYPYQVNAEVARVYLKYNIIDEALRLFDLAIAQQYQQTGSEDAENWAGLGDALIKANRKEEGARAYSRSLEIYKQLLPKADTNQRHNFYIQKITVLCQVLGLEKERTSYVAQLKADKDNPDQQIELGGVLEQVGQKEMAEECFKRALELTKDDPQALAVAKIAYAGMLFRAERLDEALENAKAAYDTENVTDETTKAARRLLFSIYEARGEADKMEFK